MRITEHLYIVGSGQHGFQISNAIDCNVYLIDCGGQYALIDAGSGIEPERIVANAERDGIDFRQVTHLLLTHTHGDHAAGACYFHSRYGLQVAAAREAVPWLEAGDMERTSLNAAKKLGHYASDFCLHPMPVALAVDDLDEITIGSVRLTAHATPGHARGHVAYEWHTEQGSALFSGDAVFAGGRIFIQPTWDCSIPEYALSIERLSQLRVNRLFAGHGAYLMSEAWRHIDAAHKRFSNLEIPDNL